MGYNVSNRKFRSSMFSKRTSRAEKSVINLLTAAAIAPLAAAEKIGEASKSSPNPQEESNPADSKLGNGMAIFHGCMCIALVFIFTLLGAEAGFLLEIVPFLLSFLLSILFMMGAVYFFSIPYYRRKRRKEEEEQELKRIEEQKQLASEYQEFRAYLERKTNVLWEHETTDQRKKGQEEKNYYQGGFSPYNCFVYDTPLGVHLWCAYTQTFDDITSHLYESAFQKYPERFGTGYAQDVLNALFDTMVAEGRNIFNWDMLRYAEYLKEDSCLYAVPKIDGTFSEDFMRIDLFRMCKSTTANPAKMEFIGGLFHILDHFSINGRNLGTGTDINNVSSIQSVINLCMQAFTTKETVNKNEAVSYINIDDGHKLKVSFYKEEESGAFYIKTTHL